ncbi:MAG: hypothetical protein KA275_06250 [Chitinophagaceae bacterium]|nr:hypothetical protein [Chitinophagaceae bacterium]
MKNFKINPLLSFVFVAMLTVLYFSSCQHDKCKARNVQCQNLGVCRDGECICTAGYEGDSCQFPVNKKFGSFYAAIRTTQVNNGNKVDNDDTLKVTAKANRYEIKVVSIRDSLTFAGWNASVNDNFITIPEQTIGTTIYSGNGSLNGSIITISVNSTDPFTNNNTKTTYVGYKFEYP